MLSCRPVYDYANVRTHASFINSRIYGFMLGSKWTYTYTNFDWKYDDI